MGQDGTHQFGSSFLPNPHKITERVGQMKNSFLVYHDYKERFDLLSDEELGKFLHGLMEYEIDGVIPEFQGMLKMAFSFVKAQLDRDKKKAHCGEFHWNWKNGISKKNHRIRNCARYKDWRKAVFQRDNYTCQYCKNYGGKLNAHHIEHFSKNTQRRFDIDNGITLCKSCHKKEHSKGGGI